MWLGDKVAEVGIIGVAIILFSDKRAVIDTFLLSCRALGRSAEVALLAGVAEHARARGCDVLQGSYRPTKKNAQVADFLANRGFKPAGESDGGTDWELALSGGTTAIETPPWVEIIDDDAKTGKSQEK